MELTRPLLPLVDDYFLGLPHPPGQPAEDPGARQAALRALHQAKRDGVKPRVQEGLCRATGQSHRL